MRATLIAVEDGKAIIEVDAETLRNIDALPPTDEEVMEYGLNPTVWDFFTDVLDHLLHPERFE